MSHVAHVGETGWEQPFQFLRPDGDPLDLDDATLIEVYTQPPREPWSLRDHAINDASNGIVIYSPSDSDEIPSAGPYGMRGRVTHPDLGPDPVYTDIVYFHIGP